MRKSSQMIQKTQEIKEKLKGVIKGKRRTYNSY